MKRASLPVDTSLLALNFSAHRETNTTHSSMKGRIHMIYIVRKEIWREASEESLMLLRFIELLCLGLRHGANNSAELAQLGEEILEKQTPLNQHLQALQEKDEANTGEVDPKSWNKTKQILIDITAQLLRLQDHLEKGSPEELVLNGAGKRMDNLTRLFEQLHTDHLDRPTLNTAL